MIAVHIIFYTYRGQKYSSVTKPCTRDQARAAFDDELNSFGSMKLVRIVAQK